MNVEERFLKYVGYDTQSDENSSSTPSTSKQLILANVLLKELEELKIKADIKNGVITASIESNVDKKVDVVGFIAHMDTAMELSGKNVNPRVVTKYDGKDIVLNKKDNYILSPKEFDNLLNHLGEDLIVTDGLTLLGGDDKAGVAEIMQMADYLVNHNEVKHGKIMIAFTPDEEVGRGTENFDVKAFNADFAYTVDGGHVGDIEYENFNAASAIIDFSGKSIHPGSAKGKMINALFLSYEFYSMLPIFMRPEFTEGYEGFFHLNELSGSVDNAKAHYLIRNHDKAKYKEQKEIMEKITKYLNDKYGYNAVKLTIKDSYENMYDYLKDNMDVINVATKAMNELGIKVTSSPIRGGTDGARLTSLGLPCPNLGTGGENCHGRYEYVSIKEMNESVKTLIKICEIIAR